MEKLENNLKYLHNEIIIKNEPFGNDNIAESYDIPTFELASHQRNECFKTKIVDKVKKVNISNLNESNTSDIPQCKEGKYITRKFKIKQYRMGVFIQLVEGR